MLKVVAYLNDGGVSVRTIHAATPMNDLLDALDAHTVEILGYEPV
jgi:hypothetical protein